DADRLKSISKKFKIKVEEINHVDAAPLEKDFFDKVFGDKKIENKEEYENVLKEELEKLYEAETKRFLQHQFEEHLLKELKMELPDAFLKKWMASNNEKPITTEQLEEHYDDYARGIKWQLIENKIFQDQKMELKDDELKATARKTVENQMMQYGQASLPEETMNSLVENYLGNQDTMKQIIESLASSKVNDYLHGIIKKDTKKVNYDKFVKLIEKEKAKK
ncbi:MAG: hypothetical protein HKO56_03090, partial [Bacteroidia bacterium]|nr:hypothetical protein [Bacteroidia bacterium]